MTELLKDKLRRCANDISNSPAKDFLFLERTGDYLCLDYDAAYDIKENKLETYQGIKIYSDELEKIKNFVFANENTFFGTITDGISNAFDAVVNVIMYPINFIFATTTTVSDLVVAIDKGDVAKVKKILEENPELANECIEEKEGKCISYPIFLAERKRNLEIYESLHLKTTNSEIVKEMWRRNTPHYNEKLITQNINAGKFSDKVKNIRHNKSCHNQETGIKFNDISEISPEEIFILPGDVDLLGIDGVYRPNCYDKDDIIAMRKTRKNVLTNKPLNSTQITFINALQFN